MIDDLNTCANTCLTTEVLTCNTLDGEPLPDNIFWVGAINPLSTAPLATERTLAANQFTGVEDAMDVQDYIVYSLPPCAHTLIRNVGEFGKNERRDFVSARQKDEDVAGRLFHVYLQHCLQARLEVVLRGVA